MMSVCQVHEITFRSTKRKEMSTNKLLSLAFFFERHGQCLPMFTTYVDIAKSKNWRAWERLVSAAEGVVQGVCETIVGIHWAVSKARYCSFSNALGESKSNVYPGCSIFSKDGRLKLVVNRS